MGISPGIMNFYTFGTLNHPSIVMPRGYENVPILQIGGSAPAPPTLPVSMVILLHTEALDPPLLQPHCTFYKKFNQEFMDIRALNIRPRHFNNKALLWS